MLAETPLPQAPRRRLAAAETGGRERLPLPRAHAAASRSAARGERAVSASTNHDGLESFEKTLPDTLSPLDGAPADSAAQLSRSSALSDASPRLSALSV
jgi:hypothetical protein